MYSDLKEKDQEEINKRLWKEIKTEHAQKFLLGCLQINPNKRDNVYELLQKE